MNDPNTIRMSLADATQTGTLVGQALDMQTSNASGQLVVILGETSGYPCTLSLLQAPTISGPWNPVPDVQPPLTADDHSGPELAVHRYTRSQRFIQVNSDFPGGAPPTAGPQVALLIETQQPTPLTPR